MGRLVLLTEEDDRLLTIACPLDQQLGVPAILGWSSRLRGTAVCPDPDHLYALQTAAGFRSHRAVRPETVGGKSEPSLVHRQWLSRSHDSGWDKGQTGRGSVKRRGVHAAFRKASFAIG